MNTHVTTIYMFKIKIKVQKCHVIYITKNTVITFGSDLSEQRRNNFYSGDYKINKGRIGLYDVLRLEFVETITIPYNFLREQLDE